MNKRSHKEIGSYVQRVGWTPIVIVAALGVVGLMISLLISARTPHLFASDAVVRVYNPYRVSGSEFGQVDAAAIVALESQYANSEGISSQAEGNLAGGSRSYDHVDWAAQPSAGSLDVRCFASTPEASRACAQEFADTFVKSRTRAVALPLRRQVNQLTQDLRTLDSRAQTLQKNIERQSAAGGVSTDANRGRLAQQTALLAQISTLTTTRQAALAQAETLAQNYQVVRNSELPTSLATPTTLRNAVVGIVAGVLLGLLVALSLARRDRPEGSTQQDFDENG